MGILYGPKRRALLLSIGALFAISSIPVGVASAASILIGATSSKTGPFAAEADENLNGEMLAVQEANANGGWLGRKLELKVYDDESKPGTAVRLYTRLITQDHADLLVGPYSSGISQAVAPLFNKYEFAVIQPEASVPTIFVPGNKWTFQGIGNSLSYLDKLLPIASKEGAKTVAVLGLKSAFTLACYDARTKQAAKLGMKVVYETTYSLAEADFDSMALAIKSANPDVVVGCTYYPDAVGLVKALHGQGFAPKFLAETVGPTSAAYVKALGPLANGVISNTGWWPSFKTPGNQEFIDSYKKAFKGEMPTYHAAAGYGAIYVLGKAVAATKSLDQSKLRDWLLHNTVDTPSGPFKMNENGLAMGFNQELVQIQDQKLKLLTPEESAEAKLMTPYTGK
jgi:branched-chain amino acid transport system substrate-binding protein